MHPEIHVKLKEILYDCVMEVKATKAALYLYDKSKERFELVTEHGFKGSIRQNVDDDEPVVHRCARGRTPFCIDDVLVAPIYLREQLAGFVEMHDKEAGATFGSSDAPKGQQVADRIAKILARPAATPQPFPPSSQAASYVPRVSSVILEARAAADRVRHAVPTETLSEAEMNIVRDILRTVLMIPGALVAAFSAFGHLGGIQEVSARALMTDDATTHIQSKLHSWLAKHGEESGTLRTRLQTPGGTTGSSISAKQIKKVFTAPITAGSIRGLYLTVGFSNDPDRATHELLAAFHQQLQLAIEQSTGARSASVGRQRIAEKIVEPDFSRFPDLRRHSNAVVARTEAFARFLGLSPTEIETARIVALVHDAGMRPLDYDRIYRKRDLSPDDLNILREHPVVGAALVDPLLGQEIARSVLCHHERFDGGGYPSGLAGDQIPLMSRIVQICDGYEAMTAVDNYQAPQSHDAAVAAIAHGAGGQFDPDLARRFAEMVRA